MTSSPCTGTPETRKFRVGISELSWTQLKLTELTVGLKTVACLSTGIHVKHPRAACPRARWSREFTEAAKLANNVPLHPVFVLS